MKITKREILFSISIICILFTLGMFFSGKINEALNNKYQDYNTALQIIDDNELFDYALRTNIGNTFAHGNLTAVDPISISNISGEYSYILRIKERYTMHTRIVKVGKSTVVQTYWTWDAIDNDSWHCKIISFLDHNFKYGAIEFPEYTYHSTESCGYHLRYVYYVCATTYTGTIYTKIDNHTINSTTFFNNCSIEDCIKSLESGWQFWVFWIFWIIFIIGAIFGFYYLENKWLE